MVKCVDDFKALQLNAKDLSSKWVPPTRAFLPSLLPFLVIIILLNNQHYFLFWKQF